MIENTTFIVPLRIETFDRLRNVIVSTIYILDNTDAQIIIKEVDTESAFIASLCLKLLIVLVRRKQNDSRMSLSKVMIRSSTARRF